MKWFRAWLSARREREAWNRLARQDPIRAMLAMADKKAEEKLGPMRAKFNKEMKARQ